MSREKGCWDTLWRIITSAAVQAEIKDQIKFQTAGTSIRSPAEVRERNFSSPKSPKIGQIPNRGFGASHEGSHYWLLPRSKGTRPRGGWDWWGLAIVPWRSVCQVDRRHWRHPGKKPRDSAFRGPGWSVLKGLPLRVHSQGRCLECQMLPFRGCWPPSHPLVTENV